jgi:hypothetical protein
MSKHIRPVFAVPEATVVLTVAETGVTAAKAVTDEVKGVVWNINLIRHFLGYAYENATFPEWGRHDCGGRVLKR